MNKTTPDRRLYVLNSYWFALWAIPTSLRHNLQTNAVCMVPFNWTILSITRNHQTILALATQTIRICLKIYMK